jgi:hypothetical protein
MKLAVKQSKWVEFRNWGQQSFAEKVAIGECFQTHRERRRNSEPQVDGDYWNRTDNLFHYQKSERFCRRV